MWTPKRIVLLALGFVVFFTVYIVYATSSLGRINGLPPLPLAYYPDPQENLDITPPSNQARLLDRKLIRAFGPNCPELKFPIQLELNRKSMVLASGQFTVLDDGRVSLQPISIALFGKAKGGKNVEINTIRGKVAYLKFDQPIKSLVPGQVSARKIVEAELSGDIVIANNHRTDRRDDDLWINIAKGPLFFNETKRLIWTADRVHLLDHQSKPKPHEIWGKGLEVALVTEVQPRPWGAPPKQEKISGVKSIILHKDVDMNLFIDGRSAFLGGKKKTQEVVEPRIKGDPKKEKVLAKAKNDKKAETLARAHVRIRTPGRFHYEFLKGHDRARFDVAEKPNSPFPQDVTVQRHHVEPGKIDQLVCQHLELRLRRKKEGNGAEAGESLDIETAHATSHPGKEVVLTSDAEHLIAHGNDFFYDAHKRLTVLKGDPMEADQKGSVIHARELRIQEQQGPPATPGGPPTTYQRAIALGPGEIELLDSKTKRKTIHASWKGKLTATKEWDRRNPRTEPHDLFILTGGAHFEDKEHHQKLEAEILKLWLNPPDPRQTRPSEKEGTSPRGRKPHHLEALRKVKVWSRDLIVRESARLVIWFADEPPATQLPASTHSSNDKPAVRSTTGQPAPIQPAVSKEPTVARPMSRSAITAQKTQQLPQGSRQASATPAQRTVSSSEVNEHPGKPDKEARPITLSARSVEAWVMRGTEKNTLQRLFTEGNVHVQQAPAKPDEKGVDIQGDTLQMTYHPAGNYLVVVGDLAQLRMNKIYLVGPEVNINQATNKAWVFGPGAMRMDSTTSLQGEALKKAVPLTVHWNEQMLFTGEYAEFQGGILAEQARARLACQRLQVFFNRPISLKRGNTSQDPAQVQNLVCSQSVRVDDSKYEGRRLVKYQRIEGPELVMDTLEEDNPQPGKKGNPGHKVRTAGPGTVRIWQIGASDPLTPGDPQQPTADGGRMNLTYVAFRSRMVANSKRNTAKFWGTVRVLHMPSRTPFRKIDLDLILSERLPEGALYLRSERLEVLDQPVGGRSNQQLSAFGRVYVQTNEFYARADVVHYNQGKDQVIFKGSPARLWKLPPVQGAKAQLLSGKKIIYSRSTGNARVEGGDELRGD